MNTFEQLMERNASYADGFPHASLQMIPTFMTIVLTCVDARVDPAHFLGLKPGEVVVLRGVGGRVNDYMIESVAMLDTLVKGVTGGSAEIEVAVIHHNDCGVARFADPKLQQALAQRIGRDASVIQKMVLTDPRVSAAEDAELLRSSSLIGPGMKVTGYFYDVTTGVLEKVQSAVSTQAQ